MVRLKLPAYLICLISLLINTNCFSAQAREQLLLITDKNEVTFGSAIRVSLYGISLKSELTDIDVSALEEHFGFEMDYSESNLTDKRWPGRKVQVMYFKLFPRNTGEVIIPSLMIKHVYSDEKIIRVTDGNIQLPHISLSAVNPYMRQQFLIKVDVNSSEPTSRLAIQDPADINGFESVPLKFNRTKLQDGSYRLTIGLALTALKDGVQIIQLPPIEYSIGGIPRKRFYLTHQSIKIKSLPDYLPPTIPVGSVSVNSELTSEPFINKGSVYYWNIQLHGPHNNAYRLQPILRQIQSTTDVKFLPVISERTTTVSHESVTSIVSHTIPFKTLKDGLFSLPAIRLDYFDPEDEIIKTVTFQTDSILVLGTLIKSLLIILLTLSLASASLFIYKKWMKFHYSKILYAQALNLLNNAPSAQAIRESLRLIAAAENWTENISLTKWQENWKKTYQTDTRFLELVNHLSQLFYSAITHSDINGSAEKLSQLIIQRKKLPYLKHLFKKIKQYYR